MEEWISLREFSRRREVSLGAVQKAIRSGRVKAVERAANGRCISIEYYAATAQWNGNTDLDQAGRNGKIMGSSDAPDSAVANGKSVPGATVSPAAEKDQHGYYDARAGLARAQRQRAELDNLERQGALVSASDVREQQFEICRQLRDKLEQIPANLSERLAAETDPARAEHLLRTSIRNALNELSRGFAIDDAAGGIAERARVVA